MPQARRALLILLPVLVLVAAGIWAWQTFGEKAEPGVVPASPRIEVRTDTRAGVQFEVEHLVGTEGVNELWTWTVPGDDQMIRYSRAGKELDYADGRLVLAGVEFPSPRRGDVVRWNRDGTLLINGEEQQQLHPLPWRLEQTGTYLKWDHGQPSQAPTR
ncbi:MAG: hypothetical protein FJ271_11475 [Planctomycetes bacterium]|nr:hypothetical protein [Planctomycetota bacterium]